jgi:hypothetical protein
MGKGSKQRPTDFESFSANFDAIFGKGNVKDYSDEDVGKEEENDDDDDEDDRSYDYWCDTCNGLDSDDVYKVETVDHEPYGDRSVARVSYEVFCNQCGCEVE